MVCNLLYILSTPGMVKAVGIVLAFISVSAGTASVVDSTYIQGKNPYNNEDFCKEWIKQYPQSEDWCAEGKVAQAGVGIMWIIFLVTAIDLILFLIVDLKNAIINLADWIIMAVGGLLCLVSAGMLIYYAADVYKNTESECDRYSNPYYTKEKCLIDSEEKYAQLPSIIGGVFCILAAIAYFVAAIVIKKQI